MLIHTFLASDIKDGIIEWYPFMVPLFKFFSSTNESAGGCSRPSAAYLLEPLNRLIPMMSYLWAWARSWPLQACAQPPLSWERPSVTEKDLDLIQAWSPTEVTTEKLPIEIRRGFRRGFWRNEEGQVYVSPISITERARPAAQHLSLRSILTVDEWLKFDTHIEGIVFFRDLMLLFSNIEGNKGF
ncbi:hypothetical protein BDY24DRAFT_412086 [Mrakia frigida]|uniref:uncharacterized protein n=1 Tax=Mrakia frigida TaxID=29902 RepID=UPI003FCC0C4B